jgi:YidC/Oxa1 family membrane protein insertase
MSGIFHTFFYQPLYNGFIYFMDVVPGIDAGVAIVLFTILIKLVLYPLSRKATIAQVLMKKLEPELNSIKVKHKDDKQLQAKLTMELYKREKINPFGSILPMIIQIPIIFALYYIFLRSGLPDINSDLIYSFTARPEFINMNFLGLINITQKSVILALLAGVSSFFQMKFSLASQGVPQQGSDGSFQSELARSMNMQMKYVFPVIVFFISYKISGVVALYWFTSNLFTLAQDYYIRTKLV